MANLADEIKELAKAINSFAMSTRASSSPADSGGGNRQARPAGVSSSPLSNVGGAALGLASGAAQFFTPAANAYAISGSAAGIDTAVSQSAIHAFRNLSVAGVPIGALATGFSGLGAALDTTQRAGAATADITTDLARIGINVSAEQRKGLFRANLEQEKNAQREQEAVERLAGDADSLQAARPDGAGAGFDAIISVLREIQATIRGLGGSGGGR